jgi:hypothetical protein
MLRDAMIACHGWREKGRLMVLSWLGCGAMLSSGCGGDTSRGTDNTSGGPASSDTSTPSNGGLSATNTEATHSAGSTSKPASTAAQTSATASAVANMETMSTLDAETVSEPRSSSESTSSNASSLSGSTADEDETSNSSAISSSGQTTDSGSPSEFFPCDGATPADYDVVASKNDSTWTVSKGAQNVYVGADFQQALTSAYGALSQGRDSKESILVLGDGELSAAIQLAVPSYTILNVCGTVNVAGTPSGSDRSPFYARNAQHIDIPNLKLSGSPQYGLFFRQSNHIHLG